MRDTKWRTLKLRGLAGVPGQGTRLHSLIRYCLGQTCFGILISFFLGGGHIQLGGDYNGLQICAA
jgi:hypothetical protein